jgi:hypothetical protein
LRRFAALLILLRVSSAHADAAAERAAASRETAGRVLFGKGQAREALDEFAAAQQLAPTPDRSYLMGMCEFNLGLLKDARSHYQQYVDRGDDKQLLEIARARIESIDRRPGRVVVQSDPPDEIHVRFDGGPQPVAGEGPDFDLPRGRYRVTVSRRNYQSASGVVVVEPGDAKPLFFRLRPLPAQLEIRTNPPGATLYLRGNRAQNPYRQQVDPGTYEVYAEATDHRPVRETVEVGPGERRSFDVKLPYFQRSGRPELIGFWTTAGAIAGSTAVIARLEQADSKVSPASGGLVLGGALVGGIAGAVGATALSPDYIRDNLALFRIGGMWIGAFEGASVGLLVAPRPSVGAGWIGGALGLGAGAIAGAALDDHAPTYGRVAMLQSAAGTGAIAGALAASALLPQNASDDDYARYTPLGVLVGLNLGLGAGLAMTYLPDQRVYGPSWQRVALVDLMTAAGLFAGALATTVDDCLTRSPGQTCGFDPGERRSRARFALVGGAVGLTAGWLLTRNFDKAREARAAAATAALTLPLPAPIPVQASDGTVTVLPGLAAQGRF